MPPSFKLEEANPCTQIAPPHAHPGPVDTATNSKQYSSSRQVAQGQLHPTSDISLYLNPTQVDSEPTKPVVGFRPYKSLMQVATQVTHSKGDSGDTGLFWEQFCLHGQPLHNDSDMVIKVYIYREPVRRVNVTNKRANNLQDSTTIGECT